MSLTEYFDTVWREGEDPFGYRDRWYEARKRDLQLSVLPHRRYARAWEIGCANGELTRALAPRCDALLATDLHPRAVAVARQACAPLEHVRVERMEHPRQWPEGIFDLVLVGEMGYYLDAAALVAFADRLAGSLAPGALLLACHWRPGFEGRRSTTDAVHARLGAIAGIAPVLRYADDDVLLEGWSSDPTSPARREGLR